MNLADKIRALPSIKDEAGGDCISREVVLALLAAQPSEAAGVEKCVRCGADAEASIDKVDVLNEEWLCSECISRELNELRRQPLTPNAGEVFSGQDGGTLAELIANSLGAAEMLSGPARDAVPVIKKVLAASAPAGPIKPCPNKGCNLDANHEGRCGIFVQETGTFRAAPAATKLTGGRDFYQRVMEAAPAGPQHEGSLHDADDHWCDAPNCWCHHVPGAAKEAGEPIIFYQGQQDKPIEIPAAPNRETELRDLIEKAGVMLADEEISCKYKHVRTFNVLSKIREKLAPDKPQPPSRTCEFEG